MFAVDPGGVHTPMTEHLVARHGADPALAAWRPGLVSWGRARRGAPPAAAARRVVALATGRADALSGRYFPAGADLDALVARAEEIRRDDHYVLRLRR